MVRLKYLCKYFTRIIYSNSGLVFLFIMFLFGIVRQSVPSDSEPIANKIVGKEDKSIKERFKERKQNLDKYCDKMNDKREPNLDEYHFIESLARPLVFCIPKKVGSLSLNSYFMNNLDEPDQLSWLLGPVLHSRLNVLKNKNSLKVMVTRHPLERLASAYNHLFITGLKDSETFLCADGPKCQKTQTEYLAEKIIRRLGGEEVVHQNSSYLSFSEFVSFVVDSGNQFMDIKEEMDEKYPGVAVHWQPFYR